MSSSDYDVIVARNLTPVRRSVTKRWRGRLIDLYDITRIPSIFLRRRHNNVSLVRWRHVVMWRHSDVTFPVVEGEIDVLRVVVHVVVRWRHNRTRLWRHNWSRVLGLLLLVVLLVVRAFFCVACGSVKNDVLFREL